MANNPEINKLEMYQFPDFGHPLKISREAMEDLGKKIDALNEAITLLSEQFKLVFGDNVLLDGEFVDYKKLLEIKK